MYDQYDGLDRIAVGREVQKFFSTNEKDGAVLAHHLGDIRRSILKTDSPCKSTWYCNTTCQKKHWLGHRNECIRLRAEIKQKKKEEAAQSKLNKSQTDVDGGTSNAAEVKEYTHDEDGKEKMTTSTQETEKTKQEEEEEEEEEEGERKGDETTQPKKEKGRRQ